MTKTKTKKETEIIDFSKPEKISKEHLEEVQKVVNAINRAQMDLGQMEVRKHSALHFIAGQNDELVIIKDKFEKEYGTTDINLETGVITYSEENGEVNKKD
tara:strand:+ start:691 stop:993 length:303 start_codon:yes stop_codon:yes gene_type:complete